MVVTESSKSNERSDEMAKSKEALPAPRMAPNRSVLKRTARRVIAGVDLIHALRRADIARVMIDWGDLTRG